MRGHVHRQADPKAVRELTILNSLGMHARPAALFVRTAAGFTSEITVEKDGISVSGKSIMGLLTIEGHTGSVLRVSAVGQDAEAAVSALEDLANQKFNEE